MTAARVGRRAPRASAALLGVAAVVLSVILLVNTDDGTSRSYRMGLAVEVLPAVLVGAWLHPRSGHDKP